jgi:hypothetical protein
VKAHKGPRNMSTFRIRLDMEVVAERIGTGLHPGVGVMSVGTNLVLSSVLVSSITLASAMARASMK